MTFTVDLFERDFITPARVDRFTLEPKFYSSVRVGGYYKAEISVSADKQSIWEVLGWLRYYAIIRNQNGTPVWAGIVQEVSVGSVGLTLDTMANSICVAYTYDDADGKPVRETTGYSTDTDSIALYGTKQLMQSLSDVEQTTAESKRAKALLNLANPQGIPGGTEPYTGLLVCVGLWQTLSWKYYANPAGREVYDASPNVDHMLGWGLTSNQIGFRGDKIHDLGCRLGELINDNQILVTGSGASNNGTFTVSGKGDGEQITYTAATISFEVADDIRDTALGLGFAVGDEMINISGAANAANNGYKWVNTTGSAAIEVNPKTIVNGAAGPSITIVQGHSARMDGATFTQEAAGTSITLAALGPKIAQSFQLSTSDSWTVREVVIQARKVGAPSDTLVASIYSNSSGNPGSVLASGAIAGSNVRTAMQSVSIDLGAGVTLAPSTTYHIFIERSGSNDHDDFYVIGLSDELTYTSGSLKIWDGFAWSAKSPDCDLPFELWGKSETSTQIGAMLTTSGQFFPAVDVQASTSLYERLYREGDLTAQDELEKLIEMGTSANKRLIAYVTPERMVSVIVEPTSGDLNWVEDDDGSIRDPLTQRWEPGLLPAGQWITRSYIPKHIASIGNLSPFLVEQADYTIGEVAPQLTPPEAPDIWAD